MEDFLDGLGNAAGWLTVVSGAVVAVGTLVRRYVLPAGRRFVDTRVATVTAPFQTSNGKSVGQIVENHGAVLDEIRDELQVTNKLVLQSQGQINLAHKRLDDHMTDHHKPKR